MRSWSDCDTLHHGQLQYEVVQQQIDDLHHRQHTSSEQQTEHTAEVTCEIYHKAISTQS